MDTIFAQSSASGKAGVTVFRVSGSMALEALGSIADAVGLEPRVFYLRELSCRHSESYCHSREGGNPVVKASYAHNFLDPRLRGDDNLPRVIDQAMVVYFRAPASFTGEDVVEIHTHGSIAIAKMLTETLLGTGMLRMAEPGEFARRAFLNGKMDLTAAEGIADLIEAETSMQHKQAMRQMSGELERLYGGWRLELLGIISQLEAYIDFPEEDIPDHLMSLVENSINDLKVSLIRHLDDNRRGERLRNGLELVILGEPNVGKSSLLNFLAQREVAIVSNIAGTTRDVIETHLDIGGYPIIIKDTAGLRKDASDEVEQEGIRRAMESAKYADIKVIMFDAELMQNPSPELIDMIDENSIVLVNKVDMVSALVCTNVIPAKAWIQANINNYIQVSIKHKTNLGIILAAIEEIAAKISRPTEAPSITRSRHRSHVEQALSALNSCDIYDDLILATEDIRMAIRYLSILTGKIEVDEILGEIFANFCIGK